MHAPARHLLRIFATGLLAALPLLATVLVVVWSVQLLVAWLGPGSAVGRLLAAVGLGVTGSELAGYLIGVGVLLSLIFGLGLLVQAELHGMLDRAVNALMQRIPLVRTVYDVTRRFVGMLAQRDGDGLGSMSPVWLHFGGRGEGGRAAVLALLSTPEPVLLDGQPYLAVLVPTAPVPVGGALIYVPQAWVSPAAIGVEGVTSIYVSMGVTSAQHLGGAAAAAATAAAAQAAAQRPGA